MEIDISADISESKSGGVMLTYDGKDFALRIFTGSDWLTLDVDKQQIKAVIRAAEIFA